MYIEKKEKEAYFIVYKTSFPPKLEEFSSIQYSIKFTYVQNKCNFKYISNPTWKKTLSLSTRSMEAEGFGGEYGCSHKKGRENTKRKLKHIQ